VGCAASNCVRLLLDEMYPRVIASELHARGHDVVSVHDWPGRGASDEDVLAYARGQGRAVVTENVRDFRAVGEMLNAAGESHAGLVFTTPKRWPRSNAGALIGALDELLKTTPEQPTDGELWL